MPDIALAMLVVFIVNTMPALMPPTWAILTFLHFALGVPAWPLAIGGAVAAAAGRSVLALLARRYGTRALAPERRESIARLGRYLDARARWAAPLAMLIYSFGPIPSNQLFIAAGLARMKLPPITLAFLGGRLLSYPLWIGVAHTAVDRFDELFIRHLTNLPALLLEGLLIGLLVLFTRINWEDLVRRFDPSYPALSSAVTSRAS